ncbi:MAG: hypothetical protein BM556_16830 [Bacteriovorax sp. MedPE-SWde]|nr:MAG: hypothetical protein BM556_16830 [Bacteriovorax sp. MedPE-SWde]
MKSIITIKLIVLLLTVSLSVSTQAAPKSNAKKAMAFCWKNTQGKWWCDGPKQILWSPEKSLKKAVATVGCKNFKRPVVWAGNNRVGHLFTCGTNMKSYDRDIRSKYGVRIN